MNESLIRGVAPYVAICGAVAWGAYVLLVETQSEKTREAQVQLRSLQQEFNASSTLELAKPKLLEREAKARQQLVDVRQRSLAARDQRELFSRIMMLAEKAGVEVDQLRAEPQRANVKLDEAGTVVSECRLEMSGEFKAMVEFLRVVTDELGYAGITRFRLHPAAAGERVDAEVGIRCAAIDGETPSVGAGGTP